MTSKHTPGPWIIADWPQHEYESEVHAGDLCIAVAYSSAGSNHDSNARLIAAAPDLLDALRYALNFAHAMRDSGRLLAFREPVNGHYTLDALLYAAIRKATVVRRNAP